MSSLHVFLQYKVVFTSTHHECFIRSHLFNFSLDKSMLEMITQLELWTFTCVIRVKGCLARQSLPYLVTAVLSIVSVCHRISVLSYRGRKRFMEKGRKRWKFRHQGDTSHWVSPEIFLSKKLLRWLGIFLYKMRGNPQTQAFEVLPYDIIIIIRWWHHIHSFGKILSNQLTNKPLLNQQFWRHKWNICPER